MDTVLAISIDKAGYEKDEITISNVAFEVNRGELTGMIGANGAGKSTTIKAILGQLPFVAGEIGNLENIRYSFIPERPVYYQELTLWEHFEFVTAVEGLKEENLEYAKKLLDLFALSERLHEFPGTFSKGMQQKGMIALALFTRPDILIIDEPFMGLDPRSTQLFIRILEEERESGTGIIMCTHILDTAKRICDRFVIIEQGTMKAAGSLEEVLAACGAKDGSLYSCISMDGTEDE